MAPLRGPGLLFLLCFCYMAKTSFSMQCQAPEWDDSLGADPVATRRGKVVLVALLKGYCYYCAMQAGRLHQLKTELIAEGFPDIDMVIINGGERMSRERIGNLVNASPIPVIQDTNDQRMYRQVFRGFKDDFLIYDRCGQAALYIPHPYSNLEYNITKQVLMAVHLGRHSCYCSLDSRPRNENMDDVMMGDDPGASDGEGSTTTQVDADNIIECDISDVTCMRFLRVISMDRRPQNVGYNTNRRWRAGGSRYYSSLPPHRRRGSWSSRRWSRQRNADDTTQTGGLTVGSDEHNDSDLSGNRFGSASETGVLHRRHHGYMRRHQNRRGRHQNRRGRHQNRRGRHQNSRRGFPHHSRREHHWQRVSR